MVRVDCHQHLWPEPLVELLRSRTRAPRLLGWRLELAGEPPVDLDPAHHDLELRHKQDAADGLGLTLYSLSAPLGIETLAPEDAAPLLAGWHALGEALTELAPETHGIWAAAGLVEPDPAGLRHTLARPGVRGLQLPATALATPAAWEALAPLLVVLEAADLPLLVHPGPALADGGAATAPGWWPALASYPAQQAAAWFAWHALGRTLLPRLRVAFVGLAGLAPLHHERLAARGGRLGAIDPGVYYETSSYGPHAIDALSRVVGVDGLVLGSDRPYAEPLDVRDAPGLGEAIDHALAVTNPHRLLHGGRA